MLVLCKTVHNLFGIPSGPEERKRNQPPQCCRNIPPHESGGLLLIASDSPSSPPKNERRLEVAQVDPGSRGLHDLCYGEIGLCTESLGSESCCESVDGAEAEEMMAAVATRSEEKDVDRPRGWNRKRRTEKRRFPPPLPWLTGQRSLFMRAERAEGRFRLTEVRLERKPEFFRASRENGRLRLNLVASDIFDNDHNSSTLDDSNCNNEDDELVISDKLDDENDDNRDNEETTTVPAAMAGERWRCGRREVAMWLNNRYVTTA